MATRELGAGETSRTAIRFKGGGGGETLCWFLQTLLNGTDDGLDRQPHNRSRVPDAFNFAFHVRFIRARYQLGDATGMLWEEAPPDLIKDFVEQSFLTTRRAHKVGKLHAFFRQGTYRHILGPDTFLIDLRPPPERLWVTEALQLRKTYFKRGNAHDDRHLIEAMPSPYKEKISEHHRLFGWYPGHWVGAEEAKTDTDDIAGFVTYRYSWFPKTYDITDCDHRIDAAKLTTDANLSDFRMLADMAKRPFTDVHEERLSRWVNGNRTLLDELGLLPLVEQPLSMEQQQGLLTHLFKTDTARFYRDN